jgi:hypothetical protein
MTTTIERPVAPELVGGIHSDDLREPEITNQVKDRDASIWIWRRLRSEGVLVVIICLAAYLVVAVLLAFKYQTFQLDAVARMANGFYIGFSRDPHLAAIGFVWDPLQSILDLIFLLPNHLWPALAHRDMAGSLVSAIAMAGAVHQIRCSLREWGVDRIPRLILTAVFGLSPMILYYSGNGMSEGVYLFTLMATTRYLLRWMRQNDLRSLAYAGVALGFSYLTRNEAAGSAILGVVAIVAVSYGRDWQTAVNRRARFMTSLADATIFGLPVFVAAAGWAMTSYVITGHFFEQFSSIYGNSAEELAYKHESIGARVSFIAQSAESLGPLLPLLLVIAILVALWRGDPRLMAPVAILGGAFGFDVFSLMTNTILPFYRYFITALPLGVLVVGSIFGTLPLFAMRSKSPGSDPPKGHVVQRRRLVGFAAIAVCLAVLVSTTILTARAMFNPAVGSQETQGLGFIFHKYLDATDIATEAQYPTVLQLGDYFAGLHLPNGSIVTDNSVACVPDIITTISQPKLFVIPNDRDFQKILADPLTFHARYILEPNPKSSPVTAPNIAYPTLWTSGAGFTKMVKEIPAKGACPEFGLFRVIAHPSQIPQ